MGRKKKGKYTPFHTPKAGAKESFLTAHYYLNTVFFSFLKFFFIINTRKKGFSDV